MKCADLLFRKWDEQRDLYRKLRADYLVEPTLRYPRLVAVHSRRYFGDGD